MPVISMFYGIIIAMYHQDHNPPHIHAKYQDYECTVEIKTLKFKGDMPNTAKKMIKKWIKKNRNQLLENWSKAMSNIPLTQIPPME